MSKRIQVLLHLEVADESDPEDIAERVNSLVGNDPEHLIDEILTTEYYEGSEL